ncbi:hypothetical protein BDN72DRAFT_379296 [Pluteus cervinus]|uniref:Uncharacterized protein n=1 Tax=Pluteus cervinus TaxID=181527 RepID=A0ACD3B3A3_9AGAR|nr:hypothetical protein BDN72DRAFT_379296 [Pluteus cervinus]
MSPSFAFFFTIQTRIYAVASRIRGLPSSEVYIIHINRSNRAGLPTYLVLFSWPSSYHLLHFGPIIYRFGPLPVYRPSIHLRRFSLRTAYRVTQDYPPFFGTHIASPLLSPLFLTRCTHGLVYIFNEQDSFLSTLLFRGFFRAFSPGLVPQFTQSFSASNLA